MERDKGFQTFPPPCEEDEIDLYELYLVLKKRKKILLYTVILTLFVALVYLIFSPPKFKSKGLLKVQEFSLDYNSNCAQMAIASPRAVSELIN